MKRQTILFLTGTWADFGKLKPLIAQVASDPAFEYRPGRHQVMKPAFEA